MPDNPVQHIEPHCTQAIDDALLQLFSSRACVTSGTGDRR